MRLLHVTLALAAALSAVLSNAACGGADPASATTGGSGGAASSSGAGGMSSSSSTSSSSTSAGSSTSSSSSSTSASSSSGAGGAAAVYHPPVGTTWQWQLSGLPLDTTIDVAVYDVDMITTTDAELAKLHADGRRILCYFDAGSWEPYRPDSAQFPDSVKGNAYAPPFQDEKWLDVRSPVVRDLMKKRLDVAQQRGCDGVEPDNVDGFDNDSGFPLTAQDQLDYDTFIAAEAHARGLSVGLKNDLGQLDDLVASFDWALDESCFMYDECPSYAGNFLAQGKAVFHAEYVDASQLAAVCAVTKPLGLSTLLKHIELDAYRLACP